MILRNRRFNAAIAIAAVALPVYCNEGLSPVETVLRSVPNQVPSLTLAEVRPRDTTTMAFFHAASGKATANDAQPAGVQVTVGAYNTEEEAERALASAINSTSVRPDRKQMVAGLVVYQWEKYSTRLLTRVD